MDSVLPNPTGGFKALGDYTSNKDFAITGVVVYYAKKGSGTPVATMMTPNGGKWGLKDANDQIVEYELSGVAKGTYNVWVSAFYRDINTQKTVAIVGDFYVREIK